MDPDMPRKSRRRQFVPEVALSLPTVDENLAILAVDSPKSKAATPVRKRAHKRCVSMTSKTFDDWLSKSSKASEIA